MEMIFGPTEGQLKTNWVLCNSNILLHVIIKIQYALIFKSQM